MFLYILEVRSVAGSKKIMISLPSALLQEVDGIVALEKKNRSEFIREAMKLYLEERKKRDIRERLKRGYQEMAKINLALAEEGLALDRESLELIKKRSGQK